jgi:membrane-associated phospholipid phosphatase
MMAKFALKGAAFPSSHVAMVTVVSLISKKYIPWLFKISFPLAIMVALGAIYGRYHYVTDVVIGAIVGTIATYVTYKIYKKND